MLRFVLAVTSLFLFAPIAAACNCSANGGTCHCGDHCTCGMDSSSGSPAAGHDSSALDASILPLSAAPAMSPPTKMVFASDVGGGASTVKIDVTDFEFSADATINIGDTVEWDWAGGLHNVVSVQGSIEPFQSPIFTDTGTFSHTYTHAGTFWYYCQIHGFDNFDGTASGMAAKVIVVPEPALGMAIAPVACLLATRRGRSR